MAILIFLQNFKELYSILTLIFASFIGLFLFWRSAKRELIDSQLTFDILGVFIMGSIFGRVVDFAVRSDYYQWSFARLLFFNVYKGFDFFGAFLGGCFAVFLFLRSKKLNFWLVLDLAAAALAFGAFVYAALQFVLDKYIKGLGTSSTALYSSLGYFIIFWALKKFEKKKKHKGFYACFYLVSFSLLNLVVLLAFGIRNSYVFWYVLVLMSTIFMFSAVSWYLFSKRKLKNDLKSFFGTTALSVFKIKRIFTNIREADNLARSIILSPMLVVKGALFLVKYVSREIYLSARDVLSAFGVLK